MKFEELSFSDAPLIKGEVPGPRSKKLLQMQRELEGNAVSYPRGSPIGFARGKGATIKDLDGNIFIDFFGGAGVLATGHCNPFVQEKVEEAQENITHTLDFPTKYRMELIEKLQKVLPGDLRENAKIQFGGPTGSDAVESAIKLAKTITGRKGIIAFEGAYHGMTSGALSLCSGKAWKEKYLPLIPEVHFTPYAYSYRCPFGTKTAEDCANASATFYEHLLEDPHSGVCTPAMTIVEPIQGEGGSIVPHDNFIKQITEISRKYDVPIVLDEIQAGFCRTGKFFSAEHSGATPDIMTLSKALGGGYPLSAIAYRKDLDVWKKAAHIGTFRGNIIAMAAGTASIDFMLENDLANHSENLGKHFLTRLKPLEQKSAVVGEVRGRGLMIGIEIVEDKETRKAGPEICKQIRDVMFKKGIIIEIGGHYNNVLRFLPPLVITKKLADKGIDIVLSAIEEVENNLN
ncbi:MAG: aminotransferase class III-fold pyridoxal phosphate-dependent enzyme [Candidatus Heimdallarchaeota archaeon]|nr:aminotransferase class III-fold pyridoxal phosphate-dependent enzyme [Candidatus Heimdallarchaeota archaeon]